MRQSATKQELLPEKREAIDTACAYFLNNKDRMRYDDCSRPRQLSAFYPN
jgi:hypothetical protein